MPNDKKKRTAAVSQPQDQTVDLAQAKEALLKQGKTAGQIDQEDITAAIPDTPENAELLDGLYTELADANIQIISGGTTEEEFTPVVGGDDEWALEDGEEEIITGKDDQRYLDDIADDSVRLYL